MYVIMIKVKIMFQLKNKTISFKKEKNGKKKTNNEENGKNLACF